MIKTKRGTRRKHETHNRRNEKTRRIKPQHERQADKQQEERKE